MNNAPDPTQDAVVAAAWPAARANELLAAIAERYGLSGETGRHHIPADRPADDIARLIEVAASRVGLQADQTFASLDELETLLTRGAPLVLRLSAVAGAPLLAIVGARRRAIIALAPDGGSHSLATANVAALIRQPFEQPVSASVDETLDRLSLNARRRARAKAALTSDRLNAARFRGAWLLRLPPGSSLRKEAADAGIARRVAALIAAYAAQYACFVGSWWLLGQAVLSDTVNRGWLLGWLLLLMSLIPLRLFLTWEQGLLTVSVGAWLRRRLLRGAFFANRQMLRRKGVGELFTIVMEAAALDAMALTGGLAAALATLEIAGAALVLWWGASRWPVAVLFAWAAGATIAASLYFVRRRIWTTQRTRMSHVLLESMMGHRTRLMQLPLDEWHGAEDEALDHELQLGRSMDRAGLWLVAFVPRGWLVAGLVALLPSLSVGASPATLAISLGGLLLAYRAFQRLAGGLSTLASAVVAGRSLGALLQPMATDSASAVDVGRGPTAGEAKRDTVLQARELVFRYRPEGDPVIDGATLNIERGAKILLEGPSGSGKTTLGAMLAGLERPASGLLLAGGLDRSALGSTGWRHRVTMAPQAHDNYLFGGSLAFNLLMGRRWPAEPSDLIEAEALCRELGLGDLLDRLPGGLDQVVGETGWQLSQGERVRVFLARALLQKPDVLVLDESFSALDPENLDRAVRTVWNSDSAVVAIAHP